MYAIALGSTVLLMVTTAYFIMGSVPLLVLKHDTPLDATFVRGFFNIYYIVAFVAATATAISFALAGYPGISIGAAALALMAERRLIRARWSRYRDFEGFTSSRSWSMSHRWWPSSGVSST